MTTKQLDHIKGLLGPDAVLLPIRSGSKAPVSKGWQNTVLADTLQPEYRKRLLKAPSIAVLLGRASAGLCSIDWDDDEALERFLDLNPRLRATLRTKGKRGANIWIRVIGQIPPSCRLSLDGRPLGEWRADGNITIIAGSHEDGGTYRNLVDEPPLSMEFGDLEWPLLPPAPFHSSPYSPPSPPSPASPLLYHNAGCSLADRLRVEDEAQRQLKENAALRKLYGRFIERRFSPCQGRRNSHLVEMVKFLFHAVAPPIALELAGLYYRRNASVFSDDLAQHLREANAQLRAVESTWLASLGASEKAFIDPLPAEYVAAFRIARDLALCDLPEFPHGVFCMSEAEFGHRLGIQPTQAGRMLQTLCSEGWLQVFRKGEQAVALSRLGIRRPPKATVWKWLRPLPAPVPLDVGFTVDEKGKVDADQMELDLNPQSNDTFRPGGQ